MVQWINNDSCQPSCWFDFQHGCFSCRKIDQVALIQSETLAGWHYLAEFCFRIVAFQPYPYGVVHVEIEQPEPERLIFPDRDDLRIQRCWVSLYSLTVMIFGLTLPSDITVIFSASLIAVSAVFNSSGDEPMRRTVNCL